MSEPILLKKDDYWVKVDEGQPEPGQDVWTLWAGAPGASRLVGRWVQPSKTPKGFVDVVEDARKADMELNRE